MKTKLSILAAFLTVAVTASTGFAGTLWGLGNHWGLGSTSLVLNDANDRQSFRFTAQSDITVDTAHLNSNGGDANTIVELRADDGSGNPGAVLATGSIPTIGGGNFQAPLSPSVTLTQGSIYHYVIAKDAGGTIILPRVGSPGLSNHDSFTGIFDPDMTLLSSTDGGANYTDSGTTLSWRVGLSNSSTGDAVGHPYDTLANINQSDFGASQWAGQTFVAPDDWFVNSIVMKVLKHASSPADDVRVHLVRTSDNTEIYTDTFVAPGALAAVEDFTTVTNTPPALTVTVEGGETYALMLESVGSGVREWQVLGSRATAAQTNLQNANFQGDLGQQVFATSPTTTLPTSYNSVDFSDLRHDAFFILDVSPSTVEVTAVTVADTVGLEFDSDDGIVYRLQYNTNLVSASWTDAGYTITGDGGVRTAFDPAGFDTNTSYRLSFAP